MAARGPYAKGVAKREEILEAALEIVDRHGYSNATVKELADAVGLSPNGLLHHFGSKAALFTAIVQRWDEHTRAASTQASSRDLRTAMIEMFRDTDRVPGADQVISRLMAEAGEPDHPAHDFFRDRDALRRGLVADAFASLREAGTIRSDADPELLAAMLFALVDGLGTQRTFNPELDVPAHMELFFDLLAPAEAPTPVPD